MNSDSVLKDLFYRRFSPFEKNAKGVELDEVSTQHCKEQDYFRAKLSDDDKKRFIKFQDMEATIAKLELEDMFCYAFSLGLRVGIEACTIELDME